MNETAYGIRVDVAAPFEDALARTTEALKMQGSVS